MSLTNNSRGSLNYGLMVVAVALFAIGFVMGQLWMENRLLRQGSVPGAAVGGAPVPDQKEALAQLPALSERDHAKGAEEPKVTLVEYSDFECPFCNRFHPTLAKVLANYGDKVRLVYRHLPLTSIHPLAQRSAEASECVAAQKGAAGFWQFADHIFAKQEAGEEMSEELILASAKAAGVNMTEFQTCLDSGSMKAIVEESMNAASAMGIGGTPGTVVVTKDGPQELIGGALPYEQVETILKKYL